MMNAARVVSLDDIATSGVIVVPVRFVDGEGHVAPGVPSSLAGHELPLVLNADWCAGHGLGAKVASSVELSSFDGPTLLLVSIGTEAPSAESYRFVGAAGARLAHGGDVSFILPTSASLDNGALAAGLVEGVLLSTYDYKDPAFKGECLIVAVGEPLPSVADHDAVVAGVTRAVTVANATNWSKRLVDTPANTMTPKELARQISQRVGAHDHVSVEVWTESKIRDERLGAVLAVSAGSAEPARVVIASYAPANAVAHVALVGKGVTFDTGGLAIKSLNSMIGMKVDMSGAAVVAGALDAVASLGLPIRITMIAPLVENMSGDRAVKPTDVVTSRSGRTIEIENPDAEGRLILADALTLAVEAAPDAIIDVATLTGAMVTALGEECAGIFATDDVLSARLMAAAAAAGEPLWPMPLLQRYNTLIESTVADLKNRGKTNGAGGSIAAALFLEHFAEGLPWAHLDIAGPATNESSSDYQSKGATAYGVRTIVTMLTALAGA
jgi:leucyl aminopeptidase